MLTSEAERIAMLMEEIAIAKSKLLPHGTGHIHTAIGYMENRIEEIKRKIDDENK